MLGKLMGLATLGSGLANVRLLQRFLSGVATVIALTIVSAILVGMLLVSAFIGAFFLLTHLGLDPVAAGILVLVTVFIAIGSCVALTVIRIQELRDIPNQTLNFDLPGMSSVIGIVEAFVHGFASHIKSHQQNDTVRQYKPRRR